MGPSLEPLAFSLLTPSSVWTSVPISTDDTYRATRTCSVYAPVDGGRYRSKPLKASWTSAENRTKRFYGPAITKRRFLKQPDDYDRTVQAIADNSTITSPPSGAVNVYIDSDPLEQVEPGVELFQMSVGCQSIPELWARASKEYGDLMALDDPHRDTPTQLTFKQMDETISTAAAGLQGLGLTVGDKVAMFSDNSHRWLIADQAVMRAGGVTAVRGAAAPVDELVYILDHSDSVALVVDTISVVKRILPHLHAPAALKFVVVLWGDVPEKIEALSCPVLSYTELLGRGTRAELQPVKLHRQDLATIMYTSGTTGHPKGVMLSHANILSQVLYLNNVLKPQRGERVLSLLPTWHIYERTGEYFLLSRGCTQIYTSLVRFKRDLAHYKPHMFLAVPRVFEKFHGGVVQKFSDLPANKKKLIDLFFAVSLMYLHARRAWTKTGLSRTTPSFFDRLKGLFVAALLWPVHKLADKMVYSKIRQGLGGEFKHGMSGGGALAAYLDDFFETVGIDILVGYGLTETSPVLSARRVSQNARGSAGPPFPKTQIKIVDPETCEPLPQGDTGLLMARGPQVMLGYHKDLEATHKVLTRDGWFNTGDRAWITSQQDVVICGRFKDTIVLSNGENIEPEPIENALLESELIEQVILVGQDEKSLGAVVVPRLEVLKTRVAGDEVSSYKDLKGRADADQLVERLQGETGGLALQASALDKLYKDEINRLMTARHNFRPDERVGRAFRPLGFASTSWGDPVALNASHGKGQACEIRAVRFIVEAFSVDNGMLTQTLKIKRNVVLDRYHHLIQSMYTHE